ncbi:SDR family NAD(P)-dependent oxidoreductase [Krasilnikovia sp. MM14-A1259]|uniref:SDR family NAD(P)-dependent oxidoreductase n=1 Tax=Krasilnikovia sp. MM14-A1259 TaxID=3373539 RepID=UPI00382F4A88
MNWAGQTVMITGASSGIGAGFATALAARGADLVLVARSEDVLTHTARRLRAAYGIRAEVVVQDLTAPGAADIVRAATDQRGLTVDALINNAGFASAGRLHEVPAERVSTEVALDVSALVDLTTAYLPGMVARRRGAIVNVASIAAFQPTPYMAVYGASKAFVLSFSQALRQENRGTGVRVTAVCPGPVDTGFFGVVGTSEARVGRTRPVTYVVARALRAVERNRPVVTPGPENAWVPLASRLMPRRLVAAVTAHSLRGAAASPSAAQVPTAGAVTAGYPATDH